LIKSRVPGGAGQSLHKDDNIFESPIPEGLQKFLDRWWAGDVKDRLADMNQEPFLKSPAFCEFASLPADIRMRNFYSENRTSSTIGYYTDLNSFEEGIDYDLLRKTEKDFNSQAYVIPGQDDKILLVRNSKDHQAPCEVDLHFDFKDVFIVSSIQGKRRMVLPNNSEKKYYTEFDGSKSKGYILTCLQRVRTFVLRLFFIVFG
jgi:hypothetical protein